MAASPDLYSVRLATQADLPAINEIYNYYVLHATCTYQTEPSTSAERERWFRDHDPNSHPVIVAERDGEIAGWASLSRYHSRAAYRRTAENSVYVRHDRHRLGIGKLLLIDLINRASELNHHTIIASISADQESSIRLHESLGFVKVGHMREVGHKFDTWLDVIYLQLMLQS